MKSLSLLLAVILSLFSSCDTTAQNEKNTSSSEIQKGRIDIDVAEFKKKMHDKNVVILDVRMPGETAQGKIKGAIEMDVRSADFKEKMQKLDKEKTYLVYCRSGRRSVAACDIMEREGFKNIYNLLGGFIAWESSDN